MSICKFWTGSLIATLAWAPLGACDEHTHASAQEQLQAIVAARKGEQASAPVTTPTTVTVNRTRPKVAPPVVGLVFSDLPTESEIRHARVFEEPLAPVGRVPTSADNQAVVAALTFAS